MRGKKYLGFTIILLSSILLSGCAAQFPDLTEEEYNQTVEYAVGLLMKYSNNDQTKITYVDAAAVQKQRDKEAREAEKAVAEETANTQTTNTQNQSINTQNDLGPENVNANLETTDEANSGVSDSSVTESDANAITLSADESQEISDNLFLSYQGYSVSSTYPESSKSYVVNADKGNKLLVLRFDLYNASDASMDVNMIDLKLMFQIILNGTNLGYTSVTFLPNDLASYVGTIDAKSHESLVILTQISEDESTKVETLGLIVSENGTEQKVNLK